MSTSLLNTFKCERMRSFPLHAFCVGVCVSIRNMNNLSYYQNFKQKVVPDESFINEGCPNITQTKLKILTLQFFLYNYVLFDDSLSKNTPKKSKLCFTYFACTRSKISSLYVVPKPFLSFTITFTFYFQKCLGK